MFISIEVTNASYTGVPVITTVSLSSIRWGPSGYEWVSTGLLNVTYYGTSLPVYSMQTPPEFRTKDSYCTLYYSVSSGAVLGWIEFVVHVYLRNE